MSICDRESWQYLSLQLVISTPALKDWHCSLTCRSAMKRKKELAALLNWEYRNRGRNVRTLYFAVLYERKKRQRKWERWLHSNSDQWPQYKTTWDHLQTGLTFYLLFIWFSHFQFLLSVGHYYTKIVILVSHSESNFLPQAKLSFSASQDTHKHTVSDGERQLMTIKNS